MRSLTILTALGLLATTACASYEAAMESDDAGAIAGEGDYADTGAPSEDQDADDGFGGEQEEDELALFPAATERYVFVANPDRDTVSRIGVSSLDVLTVGVGAEPVSVLTTPDYGTAVTFNIRGDTVSIVDADTLAVSDVGVRANFNKMVMSPDGQWVLVYHDVDSDEEISGDDAVTSYNEVSLVHLGSEEHWPIVVGFNPRQVQFSADSSVVAIVSDQALAVIDLWSDDPGEIDVIEISEDNADPPRAEEVLITPGGEFAVVRQYAEDDLVLVDLDTLEVSRFPVGLNPTDLDLSPDGSLMYVVARTSQEVSWFEADAPDVMVGNVRLPESELIGSLQLTSDGEQGVLYTTASLEDRYTVWDLDSDEMEVRTLVKPIETLALSPSGESMMIFHTREDAADADTSSTFYGAWAMSLIDLGDHRANRLELPAEPSGYAQSDDGAFGFFIMEGEPYLEVLKYDSLLYEQLELHAQPLYVGVLPDTDTAYVDQEHDLGQLSFYDAAEDVLETITGFELNAEIE